MRIQRFEWLRSAHDSAWFEILPFLADLRRIREREQGRLLNWTTRPARLVPLPLPSLVVTRRKPFSFSSSAPSCTRCKRRDGSPTRPRVPWCVTNQISPLHPPSDPARHSRPLRCLSHSSALSVSVPPRPRVHYQQPVINLTRRIERPARLSFLDLVQVDFESTPRDEIFVTKPPSRKRPWPLRTPLRSPIRDRQTTSSFTRRTFDGSTTLRRCQRIARSRSPRNRAPPSPQHSCRSWPPSTTWRRVG